MKKKVLIIANYFYPDVASLGQIITDYAFELKDEFDLSVIAAIPNYSGNFELKDEHKDKAFYNENINGISVYRIVVPNVDKRNKFSRVKYIITYFNNAKNAIREANYDVILTVSQPPILGGLLGRYAKKKNKYSKLIYNIQDFNPEQIQAVKYTKVTFLIPILKFIDNISIKYSDKILLVGNDQVDTLVKRNSSFAKKAVVINNWSNDRIITPLANDNSEIIEFKKKYNLQNKFIIMYSGNIGLFYDLENLIKITEEYTNRNDIAFVFIGEGAVKNKMMDYVKNNNINNVMFLPYQDKDKLHISLNVADVHLVVNAKGIKGVSVPSKLYGVMAAGKTVVGVLEKGSEARSIIEKSDCGDCVEPKDYNGVIEIINRYLINKDDVVNKGKNARKYLDENLSRNKSIEKYKKLINDL